MADFNFFTGPSSVPEVGELEYNGCSFSPMFFSQVSGAMVSDAANRTVKYMRYTITVDGYVTLPEGMQSVDPVMTILRSLLTVQGGTLLYRGRGMDIVVGPAAGGAVINRDAAWGPVPKLMEFQPLGAGRSAKVKWEVTTCIAEVRREPAKQPPVSIGDMGDKLNNVGGGRVVQLGGLAITRLLQFNYETGVTYNEDGYSSLSCKGTLEIPLSRDPFQTTRTLTVTADNARNLIETRLMSRIDLQRFRVTRRTFTVSRDKRTLDWDFTAEEKPYMDLPPDCTVARGSFTARPAQSGPGLANWLCTLRATYTVRADRPRRIAWLSFLALLRLRMLESDKGIIPELRNNNQQVGDRPGRIPVGLGLLGIGQLFGLEGDIKQKQADVKKDNRKAWLIDFGVEEGLYLDSKTVTFSATWRLVTLFSGILLASGVWKKVPETNDQGLNRWAVSMRDISGASSWLPNRLDPSADIIVDFGLQ